MTSPGSLRRVAVWLRPLALATAVLVGAVALVVLLLTLAPGHSGDVYPGAADRRVDRGWLLTAMTHLGRLAGGDFGVSIAWRPGAPVGELVWPALARSLSVVCLALALASASAAGGVALSTWRPAYRRAVDRLSAFASAMPAFLAAVLIRVFAGPQLGLVADARHVAIAALALALGDGVLLDLVHHFRAEVEAARETPHVEAARVNGDRAGRALALEVAPAVAERLVARLSLLLGAVMLVEVPLGLSGIGRMLYEAAARRDGPVVVGCVVALSATMCLAHLGRDLVLLATRPRLRVEGGCR